MKQNYKHLKGDLNTVPIEESDENVIDLSSLFRYLLTKIWVLIFLTLICGAGSLFFTTKFTTPVYSATSKIYIVSASKDSVVDLSDLQIGTNLTSDYQVLILSRPLLEEVIEELGLQTTVSDLQKQITLGNPADTRVISITCTDEDAETAEKIADLMAAKSIQWLPKIMKTSAPTLVEDAVKPARPESLHLASKTLIGAMVGLLIGVIGYTLVYLSKDYIESEDQIIEITGAVPLASIVESKPQRFKREDADDE